MKKATILVLAMLAMLAMAVMSCAGAPPKADTGPEILMPATFVESPDANTVTLKCQGMGIDMEAAVLQARKSCVDWLINDQIATMADQKQQYKAMQPQIFTQLDKYIGIPPAGASDGKGRGVKSRIRVGEKIKVEIIENVQKKSLVDDLTALGVVKSTSDLLSAVGMPTVMVHPSKANKGSKDRKIMEDLVNSYLTKQKLEVLDAQGKADLNKLTGAIGETTGAEEDEAAKLALAIGADVYIVFEATLDKQPNGSVAAKVGVSAFETTTSRKLASETALSAPRAKWIAGEEAATYMEALNDAMGKAVPQMMAYWNEDAPKGNRFSVILNGAPKNSDIKVSNALKKACTFVKVSLSTAKTVHFYAQCKGDNMEIAGVLDQAFTDNFKDNTYEWAAKMNNCLMVNFK